MTGLHGQVAFVIWRESMEALLVVGILHAWLTHHAEAKAIATGRRFLWGGVVAGLAAALILAVVILSFASLLEGDREDYFQIAMAGFAALLILQMVAWMRHHGSGLKRDLERGAQHAVTGADWWSLFLLAMIAVAREGSETVVFLYGILASVGETALAGNVAAAATGFALAGSAYWLLQVGARRFPWSVFFRVTEILLLALAASLVMTALDRAIGLDLVSPLGGPLWDTSWLLDDSGPLGGFVASVTGYRSRPDLMSALVYASFWIVAVALLRMRLPHVSPRPS
ncbi:MULTISPECIES: FTR1 family iron permease [Chelativorans]|jgi:high-affinity iron transporter|uniref:Iron permease FTR1 n=1 Tax=Chelativorans sp. (strain BNC1) TaxID=266779 RepID=Q11MW2_CHESB|nr:MULTISPECIES: FTR1 family protein [Chelativorans]